MVRSAKQIAASRNNMRRAALTRQARKGTYAIRKGKRGL
jgi:hypothetical protein